MGRTACSIRAAVAGGAAVAVAASVLLAAPAGAAWAGAPSTTTYSAVASWTPGSGSAGPNVSLSVTEENGPTGSYLFFFVSEGSCTTNGGFLGYSYLYEGPAAEIFAVSHSLSNALLASPTILGTFTTTTSPVCNGTDLTSVSSTARVSAFGEWTATGPAQTTFPGSVVRPADAFVLLSGPPALHLAGLGAPNFAQIGSYTAP